MNIPYIPVLALTPSFSYVYQEFIKPRFRQGQPYGFTSSRQPVPAGKLSPRGVRRMLRAMDWLFYASRDPEYVDIRTGRRGRFKCAFLTLTLPASQSHSDQLIKSQCLNQLLVELRRRFFVRHYIWRAEKQKNGNIHFHLIVDRFIPWDALRDRWNRITQKLGYVNAFRASMKERFKHGFIIQGHDLTDAAISIQRKRYLDGVRSNWSHPNSTDVKGIFSQKSLKSYVVKYLVKGDDGETSPVSGKLWDISESLAKVKAATTLISYKIADELRVLFSKFKAKIKDCERCTVINVSIDEMIKEGLHSIASVFQWRLDEISPPWKRARQKDAFAFVAPPEPSWRRARAASPLLPPGGQQMVPLALTLPTSMHKFSQLLLSL